MSITFCIMQSCGTEDIDVSTASSLVSQLKSDLKLDQFAQKNFVNNIIINWENISSIEKNGVTVYEVHISEIKQTTIESNLFQEPLKYGLIAIKKGDEVHSYLLEAFSSVNHSLYANNIQNLEQFTGTINVYKLDGRLLGQLVVFNGKSTNPSSINDLIPLDDAINLFYVSKNTTSRVPSCNVTQFVLIMNRHEVRHYRPTVIVGNYTNWGYSYSTFTLTTTGTYMSVPYPCGTNADYLHVPYRITTYEDVYDDFKILDELTGKAKCIYEKLNNSSNEFENSIKKFDGEFPVSHLKLTINNSLEANVYGKTLLPVNYITEVQISNTVLQSLSDLGKATVFAHEIIHAEIFRKMLSAAQLGNLDPNNMNAQQQINYINSLKDNFPGLYDYYLVRYKPTWNHEMMANHYRETIADVIQKFDNNRLPRSTYEAVSWVGLGILDKDKGLTTIAWENLTLEEKTAINKLISENFYNGPSNCN